MAGNKNYPNRYDARWVVAKSSGVDAHGRRFGQGERVFYYPILQEIVSGKRAKEAELLLIANPRSA